MLKSERLTLRKISRDDLANYLVWFNDPEVNRHLLTFIVFNMDDEVAWYEAQQKDPNTLNLAIILNHNHKHIGSIGLSEINHRTQQAQLGIAIGEKQYWGQGYGREAIKLLLEFGFLELNLHRIALQVDASHIAAQHCYQHCGFVEEGRLRDAIFRRGQFEDQLIMSILRPEFQA